MMPVARQQRFVWREEQHPVQSHDDGRRDIINHHDHHHHHQELSPVLKQVTCKCSSEV